MRNQGNAVVRSGFEFTLLLLAASGCSDAHSFHYTYAGRLLDPEGNAATNVKLYVTSREGLEWFHGDKPAQNYQEQDHWFYWGTSTDQDGKFQGRFNAGGTYSKWLGVVPPVAPPAKMLDAVYVVVQRRDEWVPILVALEASSQPNGHDGGRQIDLPPVMIPAGK